MVYNDYKDIYELIHSLELWEPNTPHSWGFFVYRTTYTDQGLWERYTSYLRNAVLASVEEHEESEKLKSTFELIFKEDREALEGRSLEEVREIFGRWVAALPGSRDVKDQSRY
ncbi:hypothetical protein F5X99DRAFT_406323 [Biscogniauxia marginata]|nr:hypothetical protein F5X99DRAFT_406323 [Biscogniauxia marginata]